jgi:hypothetical protein
MSTRLLNRCKTCGNTWFPRGFDFSRECPSCRSGDVDKAGLLYLALMAAIAIGAGIFWASDRPHRSARNATTPTASPTPSKLRHAAEGTPTMVSVPVVIRTEAEGRAEALRLYPDLGVANSPINREFVTRFHSYQRLEPDFFDNPAWPVILVKEAANVVGEQSKTQ